MLDKWGSYRVAGSFRTIVVNGMGGSGIVGDYLAAINGFYGGLPVLVYKTYDPPRSLSTDDLVIAISYSGNTHETLHFVNRVLRKGLKIVIVSSGGFLEKLSSENNLLFIRVPEGYAPRTTLPAMLIGALSLLSSSGLSGATREHVENALSFLERNIGVARETGEKLAEFIHVNKGYVLISSHQPYEPLIVRGKNEFNENSKIHVRVEIAPECFHNDIVGWERKHGLNAVSIVIKDPEDPVASRIIGYLANTYRENGVPVFEVDLAGPGLLTKLLYGSLVLGYASVYLARLNGVDPLTTESIRRYKGFIDSVIDWRKA